MRALVLDMTHGGPLIARRLQDEGWDVTCVDVYRNCPAEDRGELEGRGIRVLEEAPAWRYDLAALPAHCPREFLGRAEANEILTFSEAVGRLIDDRRFRIEVTGVKGKTSACYMIAKILHDAGMSVLLHSSRGEGPWTDGGHRIDRRVSIAPPYLMDLAPGDYDAVVCEVSLGGSGRADIACVTNLTDDYGIARNTDRASSAKKDVFNPDGVNIVPEEELPGWRLWHSDLVGYRRRIAVVNRPGLGEPLRLSVDYDGVHEVDLDPSYVSVGYLGSMDLALEVAHVMGVPRESVLGSLHTFKGVPGRSIITREGGMDVVTERNAGISAVSVEHNLLCLEWMGALDGAFAVVDPVSRKVCEKMDADAIRGIMDRFGVPVAFTEGDGVMPEVPEGTRTLLLFVKEAYQ